MEFSERRPTNSKVITEKTSTTDDDGRIRPCFCRRLWNALSNESRSDAASLKRFEHGMKDNTSKLPLTYSLFIAGNPNSILLPLSKFSEPVTLCQELIIIKEAETSCCEEGAMHRRVYIPLSNFYSLVTPCSISNSIEATHPMFACPHLIRPTFRRQRSGAHMLVCDALRLPQSDH